MNFKNYLDTLSPLENYEIEVILNSGKKYLIENKP
jgi:hypothetical protein